MLLLGHDMSTTTFRRLRSRDGIPRIGPPAPKFPAFERRLALFCLVMAAFGLFLGGVAPALLVLTIMFSWGYSEAVELVDFLLVRSRPLAEVCELPRRRF
jgi:hypothetical protein